MVVTILTGCDCDHDSCGCAVFVGDRARATRALRFNLSARQMHVIVVSRAGCLSCEVVGIVTTSMFTAKQNYEKEAAEMKVALALAAAKVAECQAPLVLAAASS